MNRKIIVALDDPHNYKSILEALDPKKCIVKVGSILFNKFGMDVLDEINEKKFRIFFDIKFNDIPNTVGKSILCFKEKNIEMLTVHISGGVNMLVDSLKASHEIGAKCIGVTLLTSLNNYDSKKIFNRTSEATVKNFFKIAKEANLDGVVCSGKELEIAKKEIPRLTKIIPGIRFKDNYSGDQSRVMEPRIAVDKGADFLVIGRPITDSKDISLAFNRFYNSI